MSWNKLLVNFRLWCLLNDCSSTSVVENAKKKIHFSSKQSISYELQSLNYLTQLFDLEIGVKESLGGTTRGERFKSQRFHCEEL